MKKEHKDDPLLEEDLSAWIREAFVSAVPDIEDAGAICAVASASDEFGDYQCNSAMGLAKVAHCSPRDIAQRTVEAAGSHPAVERLDVAGPGFINIVLSDAWLEQRLTEMTQGERLCVPLTGSSQTVVMDYGSPNTAKAMHVAHLRSPNIGAALDRMHRFLGYNVVADNHLGDWGTQFGITIAGYREFGDEKAMAESPMAELERIYVESSGRCEQDEDWLKRCREELVKLQAGDPENRKLWEEFMALSLREIEGIYERLGVKHDIVRGESYYNEKLDGVIELLQKEKLATESRGALVVKLDKEKLVAAIVRKSDGGFNYTTTDLATILDRVEEYKPDRIIYITDERQQLHFKQLFAISRKLGVKTELEHIWFGLMRLPEGTISTRKGTVVSLAQLLDEAERRALAVVAEQSPSMAPDKQAEVARAVGIGAVKYADLSQNAQSLVRFTWDKALALNGNSAPYLQYAFARISSVRDKYTERFPDGEPDAHPVRLIDAAERKLAVKLARFPETIVRATAARRPNILTDYLYDLSQSYSSYYQNVPFLKAEDGVRESRVRLCGVVASVIRKGLELLGIETPERI